MNESFWKSFMSGGHLPKTRPDGTIDFFAFNDDTHNGPECVRCGKKFCEHCHRSVPPCRALEEVS